MPHRLILPDEQTFMIGGAWSPSRKLYTFNLRTFSATRPTQLRRWQHVEHPHRAEIGQDGADLLYQAVIQEYRSWLF